MNHHPPELPERTVTPAELAAEAAHFAQARQPEGFADEPSVSGRSTPRPLPLPAGFAHDVRFRGSYGRDCTNIAAYCDPCDWSVALQAGHTLGDLIRLVAQHAGVEDVTLAATEALLALLQPLVVAL